jgi:hypothetical protein
LTKYRKSCDTRRIMSLGENMSRRKYRFAKRYGSGPGGVSLQVNICLDGTVVVSMRGMDETMHRLVALQASFLATDHPALHQALLEVERAMGKDNKKQPQPERLV